MNATIKHIRLTSSLRIVGDLWVGGKVVASGEKAFLYEVCNKRGYELLNYAESMSATMDLNEFHQWQNDLGKAPQRTKAV